MFASFKIRFLWFLFLDGTSFFSLTTDQPKQYFGFFFQRSEWSQCGSSTLVGFRLFLNSENHYSLLLTSSTTTRNYYPLPHPPVPVRRSKAPSQFTFRRARAPIHGFGLLVWRKLQNKKHTWISSLAPVKAVLTQLCKRPCLLGPVGKAIPSSDVYEVAGLANMSVHCNEKNAIELLMFPSFYKKIESYNLFCDSIQNIKQILALI